jgi:exocyst complex component 2
VIGISSSFEVESPSSCGPARVMTDFERSIVNHYNLSTPYPVEWPAELDESDEEVAPGKDLNVRKFKSRYSALERSASDRRSVIPGSQKTGDGRANLVQKDEPDPLGGMDSVVAVLKQRGLPVEEDTRLRNKFLLSSTTFSPGLFLSQAHSNASTQALLKGLENLTRSIDQKSASLKVLVESNFERFVRAKATIDNVYTEMKNQGIEAADTTVNSPPHSRHVSRSSGHFRNFSSGSAAGMAQPPKPPPSKNALRKESEYGVQGIKTPLLEVSQKAEDVWGPALGGRQREARLKSIIEAVQREREIYELGAKLSKSIKEKDYEAIVEQYNSARNYSNEAKAVAERAASGRQTLTDDQIHKILVTGRMWTDVEIQVKALKREIWRRLSNVQSVLPVAGTAQTEEHMELIGVLLELGVEDNPIWVWLLSRYDYLKTKITGTSERSKVEIEILRRRLAASEDTPPQTTASYLRQAVKDNPSARDTDGVIEMWETALAFLTKLLSLSSGLLGEVIDFWDSTQSFIDGHKQKALPTGFEGQSRKHHRLSEAGVRDLQNGAIDLVNLIRETVFSLFADAPIEDISLLVSPLPPNTPNTPLSALLSPSESRFGGIDPKLLPPPSPKRGEPWEDFAFWPPHSNSLSAVHYLSKLLNLVGSAASEMTSLSPIKAGSHSYEKIKAMVGGARERCVRAVCDAWNKDAESCKNLEDWTRSPEYRDQTKMPMHFVAFEKNILLGLQKILYFSEALTKPGSAEVITPPPAKLLQMVKTQFVTSVYKALSGMVENAEKPVKVDEDDWIVVTSDMANANAENVSNPSIASDAVDASSRNVRMLLTLSNLKALRIELVPQLVTLFESSFSVKLTDESKTIRDVLGQIDARLFQSYTRPTISTLTKTIKDGINAPDWAPTSSSPTQVRPYVYTTMLALVMVHTEVSTTVSTPSSTTSGSTSALLTEILSYLLEAVSSALLEAFSTRKPEKYTLPALMQATLDTEFIAQTMSQYATSKAGDTQSEIYQVLDKRTSNDARAKLQQELGDMRIVLKKLREGSRGSFGCFKRQRQERGRPERKVTD